MSNLLQQLQSLHCHFQLKLFLLSAKDFFSAEFSPLEIKVCVEIWIEPKVQSKSVVTDSGFSVEQVHEFVFTKSEGAA